jgi:hypothetical protein
VANKQGRVAGINIAGGQATFPEVVGTAMVRYSLEVADGLQEKEIQELGLPLSPPSQRSHPGRYCQEPDR